MFGLIVVCDVWEKSAILLQLLPACGALDCIVGKFHDFVAAVAVLLFVLCLG